MQSVHASEVVNGGTYGLGGTFLKCQTIKGACLSGAGLKEFYCAN